MARPRPHLCELDRRPSFVVGLVQRVQADTEGGGDARTLLAEDGAPHHGDAAYSRRHEPESGSRENGTLENYDHMRQYTHVSPGMQAVVSEDIERLLKVDTPTARSGGILASPRTACCRRSYIRSTSVLRLGMPCRDEYSDPFVSDVFGRVMIPIMANPTSGTSPKAI